MLRKRQHTKPVVGCPCSFNTCAFRLVSSPPKVLRVRICSFTAISGLTPDPAICSRQRSPDKFILLIVPRITRWQLSASVFTELIIQLRIPGFRPLFQWFQEFNKGAGVKRFMPSTRSRKLSATTKIFSVFLKASTGPVAFLPATFYYLAPFLISQIRFCSDPDKANFLYDLIEDKPRIVVAGMHQMLQRAECIKAGIGRRAGVYLPA